MCYLLFLSPILQQVQSVNLSFQSNSVEPLQLFQDLTLLIEQLSIKVLIPGHNINYLTSSIKEHVNYNSYLGYGVETKLFELKNKLGDKFNDIHETNFRKSCVDFVVALKEELVHRLPQNIETLRKCFILSPSKALVTWQHKESIVPLLKEYGYKAN